MNKKHDETINKEFAKKLAKQAITLTLILSKENADMKGILEVTSDCAAQHILDGIIEWIFDVEEEDGADET